MHTQRISYTLMLVLVVLITDAQHPTKYDSLIASIDKYVTKVQGHYDTSFVIIHPRKLLEASTVINTEASIYIEDKKVTRISTITPTKYGTLFTDAYYLSDQLTFIKHSFEFIKSKSPKGQWVNSNSKPGWELTFYVHEKEVFKMNYQGIHDPQKSNHIHEKSDIAISEITFAVPAAFREIINKSEKSN